MNKKQLTALVRRATEISVEAHEEHGDIVVELRVKVDGQQHTLIRDSGAVVSHTLWLDAPGES